MRTFSQPSSRPASPAPTPPSQSCPSAQRESPVVALHPIPLRILKAHLAEQSETGIAANSVGGRVVHRRKCVNGRPPVRSTSELKRLRHHGRRNPPPLKLRHHPPPHLIDLLAIPFAVPEVHVPDVHSVRFEDRLEDAGRSGG